MKTLTTLKMLTAAAVLLGAAGVAPADPLKTDMVSYWAFDGNLLDTSGSANVHNGVYVGNTFDTYAAGKFGNGIDLDGGNEYIKAPNHTDWNFGGAGNGMTISTWMKVNAFDTNWQALVVRGEGGAFRLHRANNTNNLNWVAGGNITANYNVNDGVLHHVVATESSTGVNELWIDGALRASGGGGTIDDRNLDVYIGANPQGANREFEGVIDDLAIWGRALNANEIAALWNSGTGASIASIKDNEYLPPPPPPPPPWTILGTGTGALIGGDLTDPENDGQPDANVNYDAIFTSTDEPGFGGGEFSFNVFDNQVGGGNAKWCCNNIDNDGHQLDAEFASAVRLTSFTITSSNDSQGRDPTIWAIEGSNDGASWTTIYAHDNSADGAVWDARNQVALFEAGTGYTLPAAYTFIRYNVTATGGGHALGELEYFDSGDYGTIPEPMTMLAVGMGLASLGGYVRKRRRA